MPSINSVKFVDSAAPNAFVSPLTDESPVSLYSSIPFLREKSLGECLTCSVLDLNRSQLNELMKNVDPSSIFLSREFDTGYRTEDITVPDPPVIGVPGPPTNLSAFALDTKVVFNWAPPATTTTPPILDYVIEFSTNGINWVTFNDGQTNSPSKFQQFSAFYSFQQGVVIGWIDPPTTVEITGLTNCLDYYIRVRAVNSLGSGPGAVLYPVRPFSVNVVFSAFDFTGNPEFIEIQNNSCVLVDISGWTIVSHNQPPPCYVGVPSQFFTFPPGSVLGVGQTARVYSGPAANPSVPYFWTTAARWSNLGDIADLINAQGLLVGSFATGNCV
jgi:hypothetical protein